MREAHFWLYFWGIIGTIIVSVIATVAIAQHSSDNLIAEMVKSGTSPMAAHCAIHGPDWRNPAFCLPQATK